MALIPLTVNLTILITTLSLLQVSPPQIHHFQDLFQDPPLCDCLLFLFCKVGMKAGLYSNLGFPEEFSHRVFPSGFSLEDAGQRPPKSHHITSSCPQLSSPHTTRMLRQNRAHTTVARKSQVFEGMPDSCLTTEPLTSHRLVPKFSA